MISFAGKCVSTYIQSLHILGHIVYVFLKCACLYMLLFDSRLSNYFCFDSYQLPFSIFTLLQLWCKSRIAGCNNGLWYCLFVMLFGNLIYKYATFPSFYDISFSNLLKLCFWCMLSFIRQFLSLSIHQYFFHIYYITVNIGYFNKYTTRLVSCGSANFIFVVNQSIDLNKQTAM